VQTVFVNGCPGVIIDRPFTTNWNSNNYQMTETRVTSQDGFTSQPTHKKSFHRQVFPSRAGVQPHLKNSGCPSSIHLLPLLSIPQGPPLKWPGACWRCAGSGRARQPDCFVQKREITALENGDSSLERFTDDDISTDNKMTWVFQLCRLKTTELTKILWVFDG